MPSASAVAQAVIPLLIKKIESNLVWGDVTASVAAATSAQRDEMVVAIRTNNSRRLMQVIRGLLRARSTAQATAEAAGYVADNNFTLDEVDQVWGPF